MNKEPVKDFDALGYYPDEQKRKEYERQIADILNPKEEKSTKNERLKYGYSKANWGKVKRYHEMIDKWIKDIMPSFVNDMILAGGYNELNENNKAVIVSYDLKFRNFIRANIIKGYPVSPGNTAAKTRERLLTIFTKKVDKIFEKNS